MAVVFDAVSNSGYQAASGSYSWSHTCGGSYRCLVVSIALLNAANEVATLTYAGVSMTKLRSDVDGTGTVRTDIYYLVNPTLGTNTIAITLNTASVSGTGAASYSGVDPDNPVDAQAGTTGTTGAGGGSSSLSVTTVSTGAMIVDALATTDTSISAAAGQNSRNNITGAVGSGGQSDKQLAMAPGTTTMVWDNIGALLNWTASAIALKPFNFGTTTSTTSVSTSSTSASTTSASTSSTSVSSTSSSISTSSTSYSMSITTMSTSSTSSSISSTSSSSTSSSTSISSTSSSISSTSMSSTSQSSTSSSTSLSSTSSSFSSTSSSVSSTSASTSSTSFSSTSSSVSTSTTTLPSNLIYSYEDRASTTITQQFTRTGTWVCPANVTSVTAECWGGGGSGGGGATGTPGGGGGGGGAYSQKIVAVTAGISYTVTVGSAGGGVAGNTNGITGGDSSFNDSATLLAKGGLFGAGGGAGGAGGSGGSGGAGVGTIIQSGGAGGSGGSGGGGAGGGSGGSGGAGGDASGSTVGVAGPSNNIYSNGARGGAANAGIGFPPGSGSGGGNTGSGVSTTAGGGLVRLTYTTVALPTTVTNLTNIFTNVIGANVAADDGDYFVEYGSEYMIREYKKDWTNNTDNITFTWRGRTTESTVTSPMLIQIYNVNSAAWETLAVANKVPADTDFSVTVNQTSNVANYYDASNIVTFRSYQQVI